MTWFKNMLICRIKETWRQASWRIVKARIVRRWAKAAQEAKVIAAATSVVRVAQLHVVKFVKLVFMQWRRAWFGSLSKDEVDIVKGRRDSQRMDFRRA